MSCYVDDKENSTQKWFAIFRQILFLGIQIKSNIILRKLPFILSRIIKIKQAISNTKCKFVRSTFNEILLFIGLLFIITNTSYNLHLAIASSSSWIRLTRIAHAVSMIITYSLGVLHPTLCYIIIYLLNGVQLYVVQAISGFCKYKGLMENEDEDMVIQFGKKSKDHFMMHVQKHLPICQALISEKNKIEEIKSTNNDEVETKLHLLLRRGEKLLHKVEDAVRHFYNIMAHVTVILSG